ncbi:MAG TPA: type IV pilus secretin PilQ [Methylomirabilota bacterium]|nr:type IV pilus secretin PilQ [Methylomirabilota bacterium]
MNRTYVEVSEPGESRSRRCWRRASAFALALAFSPLGCAPAVNEPQGGPPSTAAASGSPAAGAPADAQALRIIDFSAREESGQTILALRLSNPVQQFRHFALAQPPRIVVDIFGSAVVPADMATFRVGTNMVGTVRFNAAPESLRMSVDTVSSGAPVYSIAPEAGGLKIVVGSADPKLTAVRDLVLVRSGKRADSAAAQAGLAAPESPAAAAAKAEKKYTGQKISFDFKDADIKNVFRLLAEVSGLNIIVTPDVNRRVTIRLVEVPWDQAMDLLISTNGLDKEQIGNVVRISTAAALKAERDSLIAAKKAEENLEPLQTVYFNVNYAKVKDLEPKVKTLLTKRPDASLVVDERSNTLMVRDVRKAVEDVSTLIAKLDTRTPQVLIESNLIETTPSFARALGNRLTLQIGGTTFSSASPATAPFVGKTVLFPGVPDGLGATVSVIQNSVGGIRNLANALEAAENEGNIKIISRPSVVTLNNQPSTIRSERILRILLPSSTNIATGTGSSAAGAAVATEKVPVGIVLTVTPQVSSDGFILMNINVKSSSIADSSLGGGGAVVNFDELNREAVANVLVRDGDTIVLGGILKDTSQDSQAGVPYLKDIPVFGWLFKRHLWQKNFEELMVFITPRITDAGAANLPTAEQLWREQMKTTYGGQGSLPGRINP